MFLRSFLLLGSCAGISAALLILPERATAAIPAAVSKVSVPSAQLAGMTASGPADGHALLRVVLELQPRGDLDGLAAEMNDPAAPAHHRPLGAQAFTERFGRSAREGEALIQFLRTNGGSEVYVSPDHLVGGAIMDVAHAQRALNATFMKYEGLGRSAIAPAGVLTVGLSNVRAVRGTVTVTTPRLNDVPSFTLFRGDWYTPQRFREMYDAVENGGASERITIVEDASDRFDLKDVAAFMRAEGAPSGASAERVTERSNAFKAPSSDCGRDDRGQEPALDADAALTMAPLAAITLQYDDVCSAGNDGSLALKRALDERDPPSVVVFPFAVGPANAPLAQLYGPVPIAFLEAMVRGIPIVASAGDDGAYGYKLGGLETASVAYPCVSPYVICAGGTQLGDRDGAPDEGPWNDNEHATGGGISLEPRPAWQNAPSAFEFSPQFVKNRIVPDVSADAAGHLRVYWHGYGLGGVGGTSESAAIVAAQIAAIDSLVPAAVRITIPGDLYMLAQSTPGAYREVQRENDRGYSDNTLRPRRAALAKTFRGSIPPVAKPVLGCALIQPNGCSVRPGFNAVTGIGSLKERTAVDALRGRQLRQKTATSPAARSSPRSTS
ncbi:MAG: S53 family serine peptidase [Candidatus Velthaea sp.]